MDLSQRFRPTPYICVTQIEDQAIWLNLQTGTINVFNKSATQMWALIEQSYSLSEIIAQLSDVYHIPQQVILEDLLAFVQQMCKACLLAQIDNSLHSLQYPFPIFKPNFIVKCYDRGIFTGRGISQEIIQTIRLIDHALQHEGFASLIEYLNTLPVFNSIEANHPLVLTFTRQISTIARSQRFPIKAVCLHQCLTLLWMLRRRTFDVNLILSAYLYPFFAHAQAYSDEYPIWTDAAISSVVGPNRVADTTLIFHSERWGKTA